MPRGLVAVRGVDQRRQPVLGGELRAARRTPSSSAGGHRVVADLADRDDAVLDQVARQHVQHAAAARVVGLLGVERDRAVVGDAELRGAERLPADEGVEVVGERADAGARLAEPERGLDQRADARGVHRLVVVGGPGRHVDVRVEDAHQDSSGALGRPGASERRCGRQGDARGPAASCVRRRSRRACGPVRRRRASGQPGRRRRAGTPVKRHLRTACRQACGVEVARGVRAERGGDEPGVVGAQGVEQQRYRDVAEVGSSGRARRTARFSAASP